MEPTALGITITVTAVANLLSTGVSWLAADVHQRRKADPRTQALGRVAEAMVTAGVAAVSPANREVEAQTDALFRRFVAEPIVVEQLARLIAAYESPQMALLGEAMIRAGGPRWPDHPDFPRAVHAIARAFVTTAHREPALQGELGLERLGQLVDDGRTSLGVLQAIDAKMQRLVDAAASPAAPAPPPLGPDDVSLGRLPPVGPHFFGRADELAALDASWADPAVRIHTVIGIGGEGKTTLVQRWLDRLGPEYGGAARVYGWTFYSQGAREEQQTSADLFVNQLLEWLGDPDPGGGDWYARARRLAQRLRQQRTLLVLDGLEPLQYGLGEYAGRVRDRGLATLLSELRAANPGLVVISSRQPLVELGSSGPVVERLLPPLDAADGARLLRAHGVQGADAELEAASAELKGHALALHLLGGYLTMYEEADILRRDRIDSLLEAEDGGGHARRVMEAYDRKLGEAERQLLRLLGLFDRAADGPALDALLAEPPVPGLTDALGPRASKVWKRAAKHVEDLGLASRSGSGLDGHPLVREAFGEMLKAAAEAAWIAGHGRLFEHFQQGPRLPDTLIGLEPLYRAMRHGCLAGQHRHAMARVYYPRIRRGADHYSANMLGAFAPELGALAHLFSIPWHRPNPNLPGPDRVWVLGEAGSTLMRLGRLAEAVGPLTAAVEQSVEVQDWLNASSGAGNLSGTLIAWGELEPDASGGDSAVDRARQAVDYADRSGNANQSMGSRALLAHALYQRGRRKSARALFVDAERLQAQQQPHLPRLYSVQGYCYGDLVLAARPVDVHRRAIYALKVSSYDRRLLDMGLDRLLLGRALHAMAANTSAAEFAKARAHLDDAVADLRRAGQPLHLPLGLLARAALHRDAGAWSEARADLAEAYEIAERGEMRLHLADVHLETARLELAQGDHAAARSAYDAAVALVEATRYHRRDDEIVALAKDLGLTPPPWVGQSDVMVDLPLAEPSGRRPKRRTRLKNPTRR